MPTYLYKRDDGTTFEMTQRISEPALKTCPDTGQNVKRVITGGGGVVYKGSGWYVTDYKNKSNDHSNRKNTSGEDPSSKDSTKNTNGQSGSNGTSDSSIGTPQKDSSSSKTKT
ncbi:MAG: FmdB family zinc ribbon protein [Balneolales bacterium]